MKYALTILVGLALLGLGTSARSQSGSFPYGCGTTCSTAVTFTCAGPDSGCITSNLDEFYMPCRNVPPPECADYEDNGMVFATCQQTSASTVCGNQNPEAICGGMAFFIGCDMQSGDACSGSSLEPICSNAFVVTSCAPSDTPCQ